MAANKGMVRHKILIYSRKPEKTHQTLPRNMGQEKERIRSQWLREKTPIQQGIRS